MSTGIVRSWFWFRAERSIGFQSFGRDRIERVASHTYELYCNNEPNRRQRERPTCETTCSALVTYVKFLALRQLVNTGHAKQIEKAVGCIVQRRAWFFFGSFDAK